MARRKPTHEEKIGLLRKVYARDGSTCFYCGTGLLPLDDLPKCDSAHRLPRNYPTLDHIIPQALGGAWHKGNLRASCIDCNHNKSHKVVPEVLPETLSECHELIADLTTKLSIVTVESRANLRHVQILTSKGKR